MRKTTLVIMAAGIGSRYGGIKQLEPVGPSGEIIMDYSIYDAIEAGFDKIVFIIRKDIEQDFMQIIGNRIAKLIEVEYVIQDVTDLPEGFTCPKDRTKPWGTGHAVLCCKDKIQEPFVVINADDYYGKEAFHLLHQFLVELSEDASHEYSMAGFILKNTLSENGGVTRGICQVDENHKLTEIYETKNIESRGQYAIGNNRTGDNLKIDLDATVSMNMWAFTTDIMQFLEEKFITFLNLHGESDLKAEYLLPEIVGELIKEGSASVEVLRSNDSWFGVTYKEDKELVIHSFDELVAKGVYPKKLFS